jgi:hypothetical protein
MALTILRQRFRKTIKAVDKRLAKISACSVVWLLVCLASVHSARAQVSPQD